DRSLGNELALLRRLREPLPGRAIDQDAVQAFADVPLEQRAVRIRVVALIVAERGRAGGPVTAPVHVVAVHRIPFRSGPYSGGSGSPRAMCAASILAIIGL